MSQQPFRFAKHKTANAFQTLSYKIALLKMDQNSKRIYHFFPIQKNVTNSASDFYTENLPKKRKREDVNTHERESDEVHNACIEQSDQLKECETRIEILNKENSLLKSELKKANAQIVKLNSQNGKYLNDIVSLKKLYSDACCTYVKKDLKIKLLEKKCVKEGGVRYGAYEYLLGQKVIKKLNKLSAQKRSDSSFVLAVMRKLYEEVDERTLNNISARGTDKNCGLTPDKRTVIEDLFLERLNSENLDDDSLAERYDRLTTLINYALNNMLRSGVKSVQKKNVQSVGDVQQNVVSSTVLSK